MSLRARRPSPAPKLITGTRPWNWRAITGAVAAISFHESQSPPYNSARLTSATQAEAACGNQKKNFSGRSRASIASANSCAISASVRTTSTLIRNPKFYYGRNAPARSEIVSKADDVHAGVDEAAVAGDAAAEVAGEEDGCVGHLGGVGVAAQRRTRGDGVEDGGEVLDGARGGSFDGAGGDRESVVEGKRGDLRG